MNAELEKVSGIQVRSRLLNPDNTSDMPNLIILLGILGILIEVNMQKINPLITSLFIATILCGVTAEILEEVKPGKDNKHLN
jgi:xanthosine utilization system XapX-like protein